MGDATDTDKENERTKLLGSTYSTGHVAPGGALDTVTGGALDTVTIAASGVQSSLRQPRAPLLEHALSSWVDDTV